jgi:hypothetical protein
MAFLWARYTDMALISSRSAAAPAPGKKPASRN